ncbi:FMN-binding protein, partial [bacterium]|nr:FMN-binding protein [bacterium]
LACIASSGAAGASGPDTLNTSIQTDRSIIEALHVPDGVYRGCSEAFRGMLWVEVKVQDSLIADVRVIRHRENRPLSSLRVIPYLIRKKQNLSEIQAVTGATVTSQAIVRAVRHALRVSPVPNTPSKSL